MQNPTVEHVENRDALALLKQRGFGPLLEALGTDEVFRAGKVNCSAVAREMGISRDAAKAMLVAARSVLKASSV